MPDAWSSKDERQYQHVKDSELKSGADRDRAEEMAARTVNRQRRGRAARRAPAPRAPETPTGRSAT